VNLHKKIWGVTCIVGTDTKSHDTCITKATMSTHKVLWWRGGHRKRGTRSRLSWIKLIRAVKSDRIVVENYCICSTWLSPL
jgi:hypothetical protein